MSKYNSDYKNNEKLKNLLMSEMRYDPDTGDLWWLKSGHFEGFV